MSELKVGSYVRGKRFGKFEYDFKGEIEKIYENSVLVHILEYDAADQLLVTEFNNRAIVRKIDVKLQEASV